VREKPKQGWLKEITRPVKQQDKKPFGYNKPVNKLDKPDGMAVNYRSREYKSVKQDKTTSFSKEQNIAKASHKVDREK